MAFLTLLGMYFFLGGMYYWVLMVEIKPVADAKDAVSLSMLQLVSAVVCLFAANVYETAEPAKRYWVVLGGAGIAIFWGVINFWTIHLYLKRR